MIHLYKWDAVKGEYQLVKSLPSNSDGLRFVRAWCRKWPEYQYLAW